MSQWRQANSSVTAKVQRLPPKVEPPSQCSNFASSTDRTQARRYANGSPSPTCDGIVPLGSRYGRQCALALGREIESGDDLNPAAIFKSKTFRIEVGYRMTEKIGGTATPENNQRRKDAKDFLRVHTLIAVE